jgi:hypothetical protein
MNQILIVVIISLILVIWYFYYLLNKLFITVKNCILALNQTQLVLSLITRLFTKEQLDSIGVKVYEEPKELK